MQIYGQRLTPSVIFPNSRLLQFEEGEVMAGQLDLDHARSQMSKQLEEISQDLDRMSQQLKTETSSSHQLGSEDSCCKQHSASENSSCQQQKSEANSNQLISSEDSTCERLVTEIRNGQKLDIIASSCQQINSEASSYKQLESKDRSGNKSYRYEANCEELVTEPSGCQALDMKSSRSRCKRMEKEEEDMSERLPDEMWVKVFTYLSQLELCDLSTVSTRFYRLALDPSLWREERVQRTLFLC